MATSAEGSRARLSLFVALGAMAVFVLINNERFFLDHTDPNWEYYRPIFGWLVPHGLAGLVALAGGALQFATSLRERAPGVHRFIGRCYLVGVLVSAILSMVITSIHNDLSLRIAIYVQATLWIGATSLAFYFIRNRQIVEHREWMIRSYAITLIFLTDRVLDAIPAIGALDTGTNPSVLWFCNVVAWVSPTLILSWPKFLRRRQ